jgi:hypothetical protein
MMSANKQLRSIAMGAGLITAALIVDGWLPIGFAIQDAEARVGRPLTPVSVAGVARRTTRRTIRRTSVYAATLPRGCTTVIVNGASLYQCGATYYQASGSQYVVVNID